jgi:hypothetical protein
VASARDLRGAIESHLGSPQVTRVIYGSIIGLALVVTLERHPPTPGAVVGSLLATALAVALAELYSDVVGSETRTRHRVERAQLRHFGVDAGAVAFGISFPGVFFLLAWIGWIELDTAFTVAKWSGIGLIGCYGYAAGRLAGGSHGGALVQGLAVATIGGVLVALKALVH